MEISDRGHTLLRVLVERFIQDGAPVGSKTLAQDGALHLSPASIRNVMAELEEAGYISSPHTSAGRIPTAKGYRLFVDNVVMTRIGDERFLQTVQHQLDTSLAPAALVESASGLLSSLTRQAGVVMLPRMASPSFRHIEFLPLSDRRVLVILVLNEEDVQNRILHTDRDYSEAELQRAAAFINEQCAGSSLDAVRDNLLRLMREDKATIDELMENVLDVARQAMDTVKQSASDYVVAGQSNLLENDVEDMRRLRELFEAFQQKKDILHLMERCVQSKGVQIFIGQESGYEVFDEFSIVTAPYEARGEALGVLGVIGPTRMAYSKVVPLVDVTAKLITAALKS